MPREGLGLPPDATGELGAEAQLLRDADAALRANEPARALALLDRHAASFPNGLLVEERTAERVVVLCALGRTDEARDLASKFLADHRRSPLAERVRASCASP
jgi:RNA polymerase sigma-70 factor (ECF subfamily)